MMSDEEVVGEVVDPTNLEPEAPPEPAVEPEPEPKVHEPPPESPRFNEIYGKMKEFERQLDSKDELIDAMSEHNQSLQERMDSLDDRVNEGSRPDAITDPEGHDKWLSDKIKRDIKREQPKPKIEPKAPQQVSRVQEQAGIMKSLYPDFDQVANFANEVVKDDPVTKNDIAFSDNPPRKLYEYGLKKKAELTKQRSNNINQASVEGGSPPPTTPVNPVLTSVQKKMAKGLGITEKQYIEQLKFANKRGYA